jgi:putative peptide zinc metalloprotease protein
VTVTRGETAPVDAPSGNEIAGAIHAPAVLADGVELIGEYEGSGYKEPPSLVRRSDGQVIQLPPLLYAVAAGLRDGESYDAIASRVSHEIRRELAPDQVQFLVEEKLRPLGIVTLADGSSPALEKPDPFLGLRFRAAVISERTSNLLGAMFRPLFSPIVVLAVLAAFIAIDVWLFTVHGVAQALRESIYHPGLFLPLFAAVVLSAAFHEIGHAAACRYGGGHPGRMGCGLYLAWPAMYTDVTDAYRLGRRARLRTDLGGVYFNVVVVLATVGAYAITGFEPLLLLVVIQHFEIAHQLLPVVRLDGYYIVADITGVPDLFSRIGPILRSLVPGRGASDEVTVLKRWVRWAVTAWVLIVVPLLVFELLIVLLHLPRIVGTGWDSGTKLWHEMTAAFSSGRLVNGFTDVLQLMVLAIPIVGIVLMLAISARRAARWTWQHTEGRPVRRLLALAVAGVGVYALAMSWIPKDNYEPIRPGERGTLAQGVRAVRQVPRGRAPLVSERDATVVATAVPVTTVSTAVSTAPTPSPTSTPTPTPDPTTPGSATSTTRVRSSTNTTSPPATSTTTPQSSTTAAAGPTTTAP